jgi:oligopeptide transport system substrate-binding protein
VFRSIVFAALAAFTLVSCERRSDVEIANEKKILIVGNSSEPKGLDPHLVSGVLESNIIRALFEGLCVENPKKDNDSLPGVAKKWDPIDENNPDEWIFHLNPKAKWSDGVQVTAHDFVFSYKRLLSPDPNWPAEYAEMLYFLKNAEAYNRSYWGHILCGNDPDFPIAWEVLKKANFKGERSLNLGNFAGKRFADLEERDLEKLRPYLGEETSVRLEIITAEKVTMKNPDQLEDEEVTLKEFTEAEKRIYFNAKGIDKLSKEELVFLKTATDLVKWTEVVPEEIRQLVLDRIIAHHDAGKPNLWEKAQVGVIAVDDVTLHIKLRGPIPFLPEITKHYTWYPVPKHVVLKYGEINTAFDSRWTRPGNLVSNGAFKLKEWRTNHYLEVEKNPEYWDVDKVSLNGVRYLPIKDYFTETRMFGDDQLHMTYTVPSELIPMAKEKYPEQLRQEPYVGTRFIRVNTLNEPLNNPKFRRALALAIDQKSICEKILQGGQSPASGIVPPFGEYKAAGAISFDPEKARQLLKESGYSTDSKFSEIKLLTTSSESAAREAEALQAMWTEHLGINVRIEQREWGTYLQKQYQADYDLCVAGWIGDYLDPTTFLEMWITGGGNNNTGFSSKKFEGLLNKAENTADPAARLGILSEAENAFLAETAVLPVYFYTTNYLIRPEVKGWHPLLLNNHPFKFVKIEE